MLLHRRQYQIQLHRFQDALLQPSEQPGYPLRTYGAWRRPEFRIQCRIPSWHLLTQGQRHLRSHPGSGLRSCGSWERNESPNRSRLPTHPPWPSNKPDGVSSLWSVRPGMANQSTSDNLPKMYNLQAQQGVPLTLHGLPSRPYSLSTLQPDPYPYHRLSGNVTQPLVIL